MPDDDQGERLARLEEQMKQVQADIAKLKAFDGVRLDEQMKQVQADIASAKRMIFGGVAVVVAFLWNKIIALIGMGPGQ